MALSKFPPIFVYSQVEFFKFQTLAPVNRAIFAKSFVKFFIFIMQNETNKAISPVTTINPLFVVVTGFGRHFESSGALSKSKTLLMHFFSIFSFFPYFALKIVNI